MREATFGRSVRNSFSACGWHFFTEKFVEFSCESQKPSGQDRTAAEGNDVDEATRRRRKILP